jgi:hypothetical protein
MKMKPDARSVRGRSALVVPDALTALALVQVNSSAVARVKDRLHDARGRTAALTLRRHDRLNWQF